MSFLRSVYASHQTLKKKIHSTRIPLSKRGQMVMGFVYFCIPLVVGKFMYDATVKVANDKWNKVDPVTGQVILPPEVAARREKTVRTAELAKQSVSQLLEKNIHHPHDKPSSSSPITTTDSATPTGQ